jgi:hypothetical protein
VDSAWFLGLFVDLIAVWITISALGWSCLKVADYEAVLKNVKIKSYKKK